MQKLTTKNIEVIKLMIEHPEWTQKRIAQEVGFTEARISSMKKKPIFMNALDEAYKAFWADLGYEARQKMAELMRAGDYRAVEFILRTTGLNPTEKVEAKVDGDIVITIDGKA